MFVPDSPEADGSAVAEGASALGEESISVVGSVPIVVVLEALQSKTLNLAKLGQFVHTRRLKIRGEHSDLGQSVSEVQLLHLASASSYPFELKQVEKGACWPENWFMQAQEPGQSESVLQKSSRNPEQREKAAFKISAPQLLHKLRSALQPKKLQSASDEHFLHFGSSFSNDPPSATLQVDTPSPKLWHLQPSTLQSLSVLHTSNACEANTRAVNNNKTAVRVMISCC